MDARKLLFCILCMVTLVSCGHKPAIIVDAPLIKAVGDPYYYFYPYHDGNKTPLYEVKYQSRSPSEDLKSALVIHVKGFGFKMANRPAWLSENVLYFEKGDDSIELTVNGEAPSSVSLRMRSR